MKLLKLSFLLLAPAPFLSAAEFSLQTVDGLNRPLAGVQLEIFCTAGKQSISLSFRSDPDGRVRGTYDATLCEPSSVSVGKPGYESYSSGFRARYVLKRQFSPQEVDRIVKLEGDYLLHDLRELLGGASQFQDRIFYNESRLRPALRMLARDPDVTETARNLLSLIAVPEDLHLILQLPPPPDSLIFPDRWRYYAVTALVSPDNEDEWSFVERCALNEFDDRWVDRGAIQTLKLTGTARSQKILQEVQQKNTLRAPEISRALDYIRSARPQLGDPDLEGLAARVARTLNLGTWEGNHAPRYNEALDKALIDLTFQTGSDYLVYTSTFHHVDGLWILRGARETLQAFSPVLRKPQTK